MRDMHRELLLRRCTRTHGPEPGQFEKDMFGMIMYYEQHY
jgi:hypothetical protein